MLEQIGRDLSAGDYKQVAASWAIPALVLSEDGAIAVANEAEVEKFFGQAAKWYHSRGLVSTRPDVERIEMLGEKLAAVDVRWPSFDADGNEKLSERSHYLVQFGADGKARVRVGLTRTK